MLKILELLKVEFIATQEGKPKAVILIIDDWKRISETLKIMSSKELMHSLKASKTYFSLRNWDVSRMALI
jgi:hypothetical protein